MNAEPTGNPLVTRLSRYLRTDLTPDAIAGLNVAVMGVPQAMAYAMIAGVEPVLGIYTAIITAAIAAALGSSNHLVTGPTNALCMVLLSLTAPIVELHSIPPLEIILLLTFMAGVFQIGFAALRLGSIIRYVSNSVVIGFTAGAGILIALNQLKNVLGVNVEASRSYEVLFETIKQLPNTNGYELTLGAVTAVMIVVIPKFNRKIPASLVAIVAVGIVSYLLGWHEIDRALRVQVVRDIGPTSGGLPAMVIPQLVRNPDFDLIGQLSAGALAIAILGSIEAASISRAVAASTGQRLNFTREFAAQGLAKVVGSFFSCFAGSGSFTRTAVCYKSGGRTRMAAVFSAFWTLVALLLLGEVANYIPTAALAGLLVVIAYSMIDKKRLKMTWRSGRGSQFVLVGTLASTLILPLQYAVFTGVFLSIVVLLRTTGKIDLTQLVQRGSGFEEVPFRLAAPSPVVTVNMEGALYFAAADDLDYEMLRCVTPQTRVFVLRMKRLRAVGGTAMAMLEHFWEILREQGIHLVVCGIEDELSEVMTGSGLRRQIGEQNIFYADNRLFQSTELALARAWSIVELERRLGLTVLAPNDDPEQTVVTAGDLMSTSCIRFGNQHQIREALWLMSELQKHTKSASPEPLFLQSRDGKLAAELSPWRILQALNAGVDKARARDLSDEALGEALRRDFGRSINSIARADIEKLPTGARLTPLLEAAVWHDLQVLPICDEDGRISGLISQESLLRGLDSVLNDREAKSEETP